MIDGTLTRLAPLAFISFGFVLGLLAVGVVAALGWLLALLVGL